MIYYILIRIEHVSMKYDDLWTIEIWLANIIMMDDELTSRHWLTKTTSRVIFKINFDEELITDYSQYYLN